jgi:glutathione S-transferase
MTIHLYGHPFASYAWKPLIAAYERNVPFEFCMVDPDHPENTLRIRELSPTGQFPALVDGDRTVTQSNSVIEYLDRFGSAPTMIPSDSDASLNARMLADVFDSYIAGPMQQIVGGALRPADRQDPSRVADAKATLDKSYAWLGRHIGQGWAIGDRFTIADCAAAPALFYADWLHAIPDGKLRSYRARLLAHPSVARVVDEARPYRSFFPLGAPNRD